MGRRKRKDKAKPAQQHAQQGSAPATFFKKEEDGQDKQQYSARTTNEGDHQIDPLWKRCWKWVKRSKFTDVLLVLITIGLAWLGYLQWGVMDAQHVTMKKQNEVMQKDLRAWLIVGESGPTIGVGKPIANQMAFINKGKTPASDVFGDFYIEIVKNGETPQFEAKIPHNTIFMGSLIPNWETPKPTTRQHRRADGIMEDSPLTETELQNLTEGKTWIATHGMISYRDVFEVQHWVKFCFWKGLKPQTEYTSGSCVAYNSSDKN